MAILGIDYGSSKIGLAKSDEENRLALPLEVLKNTSRDDVLRRIKELIQDYNITQIVIGVPVSMSGSTEELLRNTDWQNEQMQEVLEFIQWLKKSVDLPVMMEDERLSTKMANSLNKPMIKNSSDDDVAAMLILQNYLDKLK